MTDRTNTLTNDANYADLQVTVNSIADLLKEEAADSDDPEVRAAWVQAEVGREALGLGVRAHDQVLLGGVLQEALRGEAGVWRMAL